uniref:Uncharacterized protein n=1 Tax=Neolamprologus brichardi TaxID=32507 RepID=A0A3Q4I6Z8_NEOBR
LHVTQGDLEKEKRKLQNIFAHGTEQPGAGSSQKPPQHESSEIPKMDRYQEVLNEIQERRQFLEDMASLGQEKDYIDIINTEISQVNVRDRRNSRGIKSSLKCWNKKRIRGKKTHYYF